MVTIYYVALLLIFHQLHFATPHYRSKREINEKQITEATGKSVELLGKVGEGLEKVDWKQVGTQVASTISNVAKYLGPALGGVGLIFSFAAIFIDTGKSAELQAIEAGFAQVNRRFDEIAQQINRVAVTINKVSIYGKYKEYQDKLQNVFSAYQRFVNLTSKPHLQELEEACKQHDPQDTLDWFYRHTVHQQIEPELLPTIRKDTMMDMESVLGWFKRIFADAQKAATMRQLCLGVRFPKETATLEKNAQESEEKIKKILEKMAETEKTISELGYKDLLVEDLKSQLVAQGDNSNAAAAKATKKYLDEKYKWLQFGVAVLSTDNWHARGDDKRYAYVKDSARWVYAMWTKPGSELKTYVDQDTPTMNTLVGNTYYPCCYETRTTGEVADMLMNGIWGGGPVGTLHFKPNKVVIASQEPDKVAVADDSSHIEGKIRGGRLHDMRIVIWYFI